MSDEKNNDVLSKIATTLKKGKFSIDNEKEMLDIFESIAVELEKNPSNEDKELDEIAEVLKDMLEDEYQQNKKILDAAREVAKKIEDYKKRLEQTVQKEDVTPEQEKMDIPKEENAPTINVSIFDDDNDSQNIPNYSNTEQSDKVAQNTKWNNPWIKECESAIYKTNIQIKSLKIAQAFLKQYPNSTAEEINVIYKDGKYILQEVGQDKNNVTTYIFENNVNIEDIEFKNPTIMARIEPSDPLSVREKDLDKTINNLEECNKELNNIIKDLETIDAPSGMDGDITKNGHAISNEDRAKLTQNVKDISNVNQKYNEPVIDKNERYLRDIEDIAARALGMEPKAFEKNMEQLEENNIAMPQPVEAPIEDMNISMPQPVTGSGEELDNLTKALSKVNENKNTLEAARRIAEYADNSQKKQDYDIEDDAASFMTAKDYDIEDDTASFMTAINTEYSEEEIAEINQNINNLETELNKETPNKDVMRKAYDSIKDIAKVNLGEVSQRAKIIDERYKNYVVLSANIEQISEELSKKEPDLDKVDTLIRNMNKIKNKDNASIPSIDSQMMKIETKRYRILNSVNIEQPNDIQKTNSYEDRENIESPKEEKPKSAIRAYFKERRLEREEEERETLRFLDSIYLEKYENGEKPTKEEEKAHNFFVKEAELEYNKELQKSYQDKINKGEKPTIEEQRADLFMKKQKKPKSKVLKTVAALTVTAVGGIAAGVATGGVLYGAIAVGAIGAVAGDVALNKGRIIKSIVTGRVFRNSRKRENKLEDKPNGINKGEKSPDIVKAKELDKSIKEMDKKIDEANKALNEKLKNMKEERNKELAELGDKKLVSNRVNDIKNNTESIKKDKETEVLPEKVNQKEKTKGLDNINF